MKISKSLLETLQAVDLLADLAAIQGAYIRALEIRVNALEAKHSLLVDQVLGIHEKEKENE